MTEKAGDPVPQSDGEGDGEAGGEGEAAGELVARGDVEAEAQEVALPLPLPLCVPLAQREGEGVAVPLREGEGGPLALGEALLDSLPLGEPNAGEGEAEAVLDGARPEAPSLPVGEGQREDEAQGVVLPVELPLPLVVEAVEVARTHAGTEAEALLPNATVAKGAARQKTKRRDAKKKWTAIEGACVARGAVEPVDGW